jgi:hypothetical protein
VTDVRGRGRRRRGVGERQQLVRAKLTTLRQHALKAENPCGVGGGERWSGVGGVGAGGGGGRGGGGWGGGGAGGAGGMHQCGDGLNTMLPL